MGGVGLLTDVERKSFEDVPFRIDQGGRFQTTNATTTISTDGALCTGTRQRKGERRPGGWAFVVHGTDEEHGGHDCATTNNRMELHAVIEALRRTPDGASVIIRTDSQYIDSVRNKGAAVQPNADLWKAFEAEAATRRVKIAWVKGHNGDLYNERADKLAGEQAEQARLMSEADLVPNTG